ncbi:uncharacterized protein METZ01_LOCUS468915, partial [marine metagenome]
LTHQMTEEDRQRNDKEMENWAVEHERRKEEGYFPKGVESEEGKGCWESMCFVLKFEWNYSQNRHQIMESGISEEDELIRIRHSLADFQDSPPNLPKSEICVIEGAFIASATYLCRRIGKPIPQSVFKKENSQLGQVRSPITFFIEEQIKSGEQEWQKAWKELNNMADMKNTKTENLTLHNFGEKDVYLCRDEMKQTSNKLDHAIKYQVDGALTTKTVTRQDFGRMFRDELKKSRSRSETPQ